MELTEQDLAWARETILKTGLFNTCSPDELKELADGLDKCCYRSGATIFLQGEIASRLMLVESGTVGVYQRRGREKNRVAELGPGSYFGEISLLMPRAATATVKAETETSIISLPGEVVQALVSRNPVLAGILNLKIEERLQPTHPAENK